MQGSCPGEEELLDYIENRLSQEDRNSLEAHFASCERCLEELAITKMMMQASDKIQTEPVPRKVTESAVAAATGRHSSGPVPIRVKRALKHLSSSVFDVMGMNNFNRMQFAQVRGARTAGSNNLICLDVRFGHMDTKVEIEKTLQDTAHIRVKPTDPHDSHQSIRMTLKKGDREVASYILNDFVLFEDIPFGRYSLTMLMDGTVLGTYYFEIKESASAHGKKD